MTGRRESHIAASDIYPPHFDVVAAGDFQSLVNALIPLSHPPRIAARVAQVEELEHVGREVRNLQGVAGVTNDLLGQVLSELRRQREQLVTVGAGLKRR